MDTAPTPATRPPWLPPDGQLHAVEAGIWWDVVAIDGDLGRAARDALRARPECGPIACAHRSIPARWYFLLPTGTSPTWSEPETQALGTGCHIGLPGDLTAHHPVRWDVPPASSTPHLTTPGQLHTAVQKARTPTGGPA